MDVAKQRELVEALLACQSMDSQKRRDAVVGDLRERIQSSIDRSPADREDVAAIVRTCLKFPNGLEELVAAVRVRDQGSLPLQDLDRLILRLFNFDLSAEEACLRLLSILAGVQASPDILQRTYQRLLPPSVTSPPDTTGLFSMLPHLWHVSRELSARERSSSLPVLDFLEQLARDASGSVAGPLRAWATEVTSLLTMGRPSGRDSDVSAGSTGTGTGDGGMSALNPRLAILSSVLALLYPTVEASGELVAAARLNPVGIEFREIPSLNWHNILTSAARRDRVGHLIEAALADQPDNTWLQVAQQEEQKTRDVQARQVTRRIAGDAAGDTPASDTVPRATTWPQHISFLQEGLARSRSIVGILHEHTIRGTGFLVRGNLLVTHGSIIPTREDALRVTLQCNFERTAGELVTTPEEYKLAPEEGFATGVEGSPDMRQAWNWTAVRVSGAPIDRWGCLDLEPAAPQVHDPISLVHHVGGGPKQLELLNSEVLFVNDFLLEYTRFQRQPGSGGAPVFDLNWRVIGMHYAAGMMAEPGGERQTFRGEATHVNVIIEGLKAAGLYIGKEG